ncbi:MAG: formylglycine-generating enzyme family protein [Verrucomicrobiota bacterium]
MTDPAKTPSCCAPDSDRRPLDEERPPIEAGPKAGSKRGMVSLSGGTFLMGAEGPEAWAQDGEGPVREVSLSPFYLDRCSVTNAQFAEFIEATGYKTEAETFGWSAVFVDQISPTRDGRISGEAAMGTPWWRKVEGASWHKPGGPGTDLRTHQDHPVVHVSWQDAQAYAQWMGKRLPTEAEWEFAARGGLEQALYPWGDELTPNGEHHCNIWQGAFPHHNTADDGFTGTAPVRSFRPNGYGFYNMAGNVWNWVADWFSPSWHRQGPREDPQGPDSGPGKVIRGGSYLCHDSYCNRYRVSARTSVSPDSSTGHLGIRLARSR